MYMHVHVHVSVGAYRFSNKVNQSTTYLVSVVHVVEFYHLLLDRVKAHARSSHCSHSPATRLLEPRFVESRESAESEALTLAYLLVVDDACSAHDGAACVTALPDQCLWRS